MTMIETDSLTLCECCALLIANGDESGCRDYYGHTHETASVPAHTILTGDSDQPCYAFTCHGCRESQEPFAYRLWAVVLETKHTWGYDFERPDWWCFDCSTITDWCDQA